MSAGNTDYLGETKPLLKRSFKPSVCPSSARLTHYAECKTHLGVLKSNCGPIYHFDSWLQTSASLQIVTPQAGKVLIGRRASISSGRYPPSTCSFGSTCRLTLPHLSRVCSIATDLSCLIKGYESSERLAHVTWLVYTFGQGRNTKVPGRSHSCGRMCFDKFIGRSRVTSHDHSIAFGYSLVPRCSFERLTEMLFGS